MLLMQFISVAQYWKERVYCNHSSRKTDERTIMKKQKLKLFLLIFSLVFLHQQSFATTIDGSLFMSGYMAADSSDLNCLNFFSPFDLALTNHAEGDYGSAFPTYAGRNLLMGRIYKNEPTQSEWDFGDDALITYKFLFTSFDVLTVNGNSFYASGSGIASITGFDDTLASWVITGSQDRIALKSSATFTANGIPVPEYGQTFLLTVLGIAILTGIKRRWTPCEKR